MALRAGSNPAERAAARASGGTSGPNTICSVNRARTASSTGASRPVVAAGGVGSARGLLLIIRVPRPPGVWLPRLHRLERVVVEAGIEGAPREEALEGFPRDATRRGLGVQVRDVLVPQLDKAVAGELRAFFVEQRAVAVVVFHGVLQLVPDRPEHLGLVVGQLRGEPHLVFFLVELPEAFAVRAEPFDDPRPGQSRALPAERQRRLGDGVPRPLRNGQRNRQVSVAHASPDRRGSLARTVLICWSSLTNASSGGPSDRRDADGSPARSRAASRMNSDKLLASVIAAPLSCTRSSGLTRIPINSDFAMSHPPENADGPTPARPSREVGPSKSPLGFSALYNRYIKALHASAQDGSRRVRPPGQRRRPPGSPASIPCGPHAQQRRRRRPA